MNMNNGITHALAPRRSPMPMSRHSRQPFPSYGQDEAMEAPDVLTTLATNGAPTIRSMVRALNLEGPYDFLGDQDQVEYYMRGIREGGVGLASSHAKGAVHVENVKRLKESIHHLGASVESTTKEKEEELKRWKATKEVVGELNDFWVRYDEFTKETSSEVRGIKVATPTTLDGTIATPAASPFSFSNLPSGLSRIEFSPRNAVETPSRATKRRRDDGNSSSMMM